MTANLKGFSLIEVMIAFVLIGVASLGLIKLHSYVESKAEYATKSLDALSMIEYQLEHFRQRGVSSALHSYTLLDAHQECNDMVTSSSSTSIQLRCESELMLSESLSYISITAYWYDRYQHDKEVNIVTMLSKYSEF
jgi:type IV pilus assembly protein PilV